MKIVLIGAGNVAVHLGPALSKKKHTIVQVFSRSEKSGKYLAKKLKCPNTVSTEQLVRDADAYIVALRDDAIAPFLRKLTFVPKLIVHTSGSVGIDIFPKKMVNAGVMYPLQTFSKSSLKLIAPVPFCIEGRNKNSLNEIRRLTNSISKKIYAMNSDDRAFVHLAAVFANNFSNYLFSISEMLVNRKKISFDILRPLILETAMKIQEQLPRNVQTGPAKRGDSTIIRKHLKLLKEFPELKKIYDLLSKEIEKEFAPKL